MEKINKSLVALMLLATMLSFTVRADETSDYRQFVEDTKDWVYSMELPAFEVREIPEKYKNESAVYIAVYDNLAMMRDAGVVRMPGTLRYSEGGYLEVGDLERKLIYINDRSALEKFSEYEYRTHATLESRKGMGKFKAVIGVRIIKPDGTIVDVNTDDYIEVKDGKKDKDVRNKIAVPGLEVGDIIDMFYYISQDLHNVQPEPMLFVLREDYPVMNYSIHWLIDGSLSSSYRSLNGAPEFAGLYDGAGNFNLDMELKDVPATPRLYYDDMIQSPMIKLYVFNYRADGYIPESSKAVGLRPNPDANWIKNDRWKLRWSFYHKDLGAEMLRSTLKNGWKVSKKLADMYKSGEKSLTDVTDCLYNLLTFAYIGADEDVIPVIFDVQLQGLLADVVGDSLYTVMTTSSKAEPLDEVVSVYSLTTGLALPDGKRYYFPPRGVMAPSELHPYFTGRRAQQYAVADQKKKNLPNDTVYFNLPETRASRNRKYSNLKVVLDGSDAVVSRNVSSSGSMKLAASDVLVEEDIVNAYLDYFAGMGLDIAVKEGGKKAADRARRNADARIEQKKDFEDEVKSFNPHIEVDSVKGTVLTVGIDPKSPKLAYDVDYLARNIARKAGKNILVSIGKLSEDYGEVLDSDRERSDYIVSRSAREYINKIEIAIPEGCTVSEKTIEGLSRQVSNSAGMFAVTARLDDNALVAEVIMRFDRRFLPVEAWPQVLELLDAASEWQSATVLFERS